MLVNLESFLMVIVRSYIFSSLICVYAAPFVAQIKRILEEIMCPLREGSGYSQLLLCPTGYFSYVEDSIKD